MDIDKLEEQAEAFYQNVANWEEIALERIGKRILKIKKMNISDIKALNNIADVNGDFKVIMQELAEITNLNISEITKIYSDAIEELHLKNKPLYDYRDKKFVPFSENKTLQNIVSSIAKTTASEMVNFTKTSLIGFSDYSGKNFTNFKKAYTDVLDKAVVQVSSGSTDFYKAMRDSIVELGGSGVKVNYASGVTRRLDTVVRQTLLYGVKQISNEYFENIGKELNCDGIEIDWHSNPRPSHEYMQGKQYALGKAKTVKGVRYESADRPLESLQDYGCLHYKTPIILGVSEPRYSKQQLDELNKKNAKKYNINGKEISGYEATQMLRRLETNVRNQKSTRVLARAAGDNTLSKECTQKIKAYRQKYDEICEITGIKPNLKRMSVPRQ